MATNRNENGLREYPFRLEKIPRVSWDDPAVDEFIADNRPVVITGCDLVDSAKKWDLDYLERSMTNSYTVVLSKTHKFMYYDEKKATSALLKEKFVPTTRRCQMPFTEFTQRLRNWREGDERVYLQQPICNNIGMSAVTDFLKFKWEWIMERQVKHNWGPLTSNLLLISMEGNVTPCHYDEQENFFAQIKGSKRCILFPPSEFGALYPYPVYHPYDRQSQVDFENPKDYDEFPNFRDATGFETILGPGEILYIPVYWFHHIESLMNVGGYTISLNFWYKAGPTTQITHPLKDYQKTVIMRNLEKMMLEVLGDPAEVGRMLTTIMNRYANP